MCMYDIIDITHFSVLKQILDLDVNTCIVSKVDIQVEHDIGEIGSIMFHNSNEIHTIDILLAETVFSFIDINYHQVQACLTFIDVTAFLSFHITFLEIRIGTITIIIRKQKHYIFEY